MLLARLDRLVERKLFPNRSKAIQAAVQDKLARLDRTPLARERANLNAANEKALAEEGMDWRS
jgi:Arc/MetJ-type ribon-helix-helix transcriptional regulator